MKKIVPALSLAMALGLMGLATGCASSRGGDAGSTAGGSGITVFGTIDAGVSGTRNRSSRD
ncbi:hypothetical protein GCM10023165_55900 [Variovorax defluvii]|uniref:Lipoprotein n=1 Tax=Variovorax defluvii TaxID=913761 RepID=A0ABP8IIU3_9BURK